MKLIVGLGNPDYNYNNTRHNIGFMVLELLVKKINLSFNKEKMGGLYCDTTVKKEKVIFLKPQNYINLSGEVIVKFLDYYKIKKEDMLVIHDDLDIEVGKYKLKAEGSSAGHNGLKNIEFELKTKKYNRLKIGISNNKQIDTKEYVLGKFGKEELKKIQEVILIAEEIIMDFINNDMITLMNKYNNK